MEKDYWAYDGGSGGWVPKGVALPYEKDGKATAIVMFDETILRNLSPESYFDAEALSTILEEVLHADLYSRTWERRGFLNTTREQRGCANDFYVLAEQFHDEYAVNRRKANILATSFKAPDEHGNLVPVGVSGAIALDKALNQAAIDLREIVVTASMGLVPSGEAWQALCRRIYRGIFDPLARMAGYVSGDPDSEHINNNASESWFYKYISPYWEQIHRQLERSFDSTFTETEQALLEIVAELEAFAASIGVTYHRAEDGGCWVDFNNGFFAALESRNELQRYSDAL